MRWAYESQLRSDRAEWHRRLAAAVETTSPEVADQNAALIAEHLEAAGDLHAAFGWHMRAGEWSANRDVSAARVSWERARQIADALPASDPKQLAMRIAPRTMLCATGWQAIQESQGRFDELRELCSAANDQVSLAIGMTGLATELLFASRSGEGSRLVSEQMELLGSIGDPTLIGLAFIAFNNWFDAGEFGEIMRWSQAVIDLADGDPTKGASFGFGSPLAAALAWRGVAGWWLGGTGWQSDLHHAYAIARQSDPTTLAMIVGWTSGLGIDFGVRRADDSALRTIEEAVQTAEGSSNAAFSIVEYALAVALLNRDCAADRRRGLDLMMKVRDIWLREPISFLVPVAELCSARERARQGDRDGAISVIRRAVDDLGRAGRPFFGVLGIGVLVELLLERGADGDLIEARVAMDQLANMRPDEVWAMRDITLLRLRALLARTCGDEGKYRDLVSQYCATAESLGYEGHTAWAQAMIEGR